MANGLRIVAFNVVPMAYAAVAAWAEARGHRIVLLVTSPAARDGRYGVDHLDLIASLPPNQDVLVTQRLRRTAAPIIAALAPDLIIAATFPHRIPPEVTAIPRFGAVNLHPAPLPRGRGPNPLRLIYEGDRSVAFTLHRIAPEFDAGPVLSQRTRELPDPNTGAIMAAWGEMLFEILDEGVARAVAGELGEEQDDTLATYAGVFIEEERWLDWNEPATTIQRRAAALNMTRSSARAVIDGRPYDVTDARAALNTPSASPPGTILEKRQNTFLLQTGAGTIEVTVAPEPAAP